MEYEEQRRRLLEEEQNKLDEERRRLQQDKLRIEGETNTQYEKDLLESQQRQMAPDNSKMIEMQKQQILDKMNYLRAW